MDVSAPPADPEDAGKWQMLAVIYVVLVLLLLIPLQIFWERRRRMKWNRLQWEHIAQSSRKCSAAFMAAFRIFCCLMVLVVDVVMVVRDPENPLVGGFSVFATFTVWSWTLIGVYMGLAGFASVLSALGKAPEAPGDELRSARCLCRIAWLLFEVMLPVSFLIFLAVWLILLPAAYKSTGTDMGLFSASSLAAHNLNFVFMLTEALLNRLCITSYHFIFVFYYGGLYVVFSWIFYAFHHFFFYFFIDWRYPLVLIGYTALLSMLTIFYFLGRCLVNCVKPPLYTWDLEQSSSGEESSASSESLE
ncbi:unnamed protein product [Effrenium voratum]|uniref:Uncharacterized protein n=1 Tax=Effrenium voratum TaxID=2562239 RepID=A0AA36IN30_9DINO|nr:unnamed protein product [Effrenium voratum]